MSVMVVSGLHSKSMANAETHVPFSAESYAIVIALSATLERKTTMDDDRLRSRAARLYAIGRYLYQCGDRGATVIELADNFAIDRSQIYKDLEHLEQIGEPIYKNDSRWCLDRERYINRVPITLRETLALYLAARLLSKQSDKHNPHVVSALDKLGEALALNHQNVGLHIRRAADAVRQRRADAGFVKVFETFARAWADQCRVEVTYLSARQDSWEQRIIAPYYLEVSGIGYATYIIGHDSKSNAIRTFKLERIAAAHIRPFDRFDIPDSFDAQARLGNAWGVIWPAEGEEPIEVRLRFSIDVARRVKETIWHPSQIIEDLPEGGCRYTVRVGSTKEMRPWVRGWGKDVEVEAPDGFRAEIAAELQSALAQYASGTP